ncbi:MAG TPA: hypothetical protein VFB76_19850, partial [Candidatus Angelobacter sp.]|nr:hypothetical protein [Candidatus Angelobacter sp.]
MVTKNPAISACTSPLNNSLFPPILMAIMQVITLLRPIIYHHYRVHTIRVRTKPESYNVLIGAGLLRRAGRELRRLLPSPSSRVFVITSPNVRRHWGEKLETLLRQARLPYEVLEMHD